ncbi:MAG: ABC transporter permease [Bacillota bacterium]|nr:ABC transporter permease [Bacillota bacterium]
MAITVRLRTFWKRFRRHGSAVVGLWLVVAFLLVALFAPQLAPHDYRVQNLEHRLKDPSRAYLLGTDEFGRDILSRIIMGTRVSFQVGFASTIVAVSVGTVIGLVAGAYGGSVDSVLMRITDIFMSIPSLFLMIVVVALFGPNLTNTIIVIAFVNWTGSARLARAGTLAVRSLGYVESANAMGCSPLRVIFRHVLPNIAAPIIVNGSLFLGRAIGYEASLSYLQLGAQPPTPSWGNMIADAQRFLSVNWWAPVYPGLAILITVLAFNLIGDGVRDALDPKLIGS